MKCKVQDLSASSSLNKKAKIKIWKLDEINSILLNICTAKIRVLAQDEVEIGLFGCLY